MPILFGTALERIREHRILAFLCLVVALNLATLASVLPSGESQMFIESESTGAADPSQKLSLIDGPMIGSGAAAVALGNVKCFSLPAGVWIFLLVAYTALLLFNVSASVSRPGAFRVKWAGEALLTLAFLGMWGAWDECRSALWFPLATLQLGLVIYGAYLYFFERKKRG